MGVNKHTAQSVARLARDAQQRTSGDIPILCVWLKHAHASAYRGGSVQRTFAGLIQEHFVESNVTTLKQLKAHLRKMSMHLAGEDGESFARRWLAANKWEYVDLDQRPETYPEEMRRILAKRPDFLADAGDGLYLLLDAKYHSTNQCRTFTLTEAELRKYRSAVRFLEGVIREDDARSAAQLWFMVFPKECDGNRLVFVELSEIENGPETTLRNEPARSVSLEARDEWWADNPENP